MLQALAILLLAASPTERSVSEFYVDAPGTIWHFDTEGKAEFNVSIDHTRAEDGVASVWLEEKPYPSHDYEWRLTKAGWEQRDFQITSEFMLVLPAKFHLGSTWSWHYISAGSHKAFDIHYTVISMNDSILLKNKKRVSGCVVVEEKIDGSGGVRHHWFAPHQGEIAVEMVVEDIKSWDRSLNRLETPAKK